MPDYYHYPAEYHDLKLVNHGGLCCGIKTIFGFNGFPDGAGELIALPLMSSPNNYDSHGLDVSSKDRFFTDAAPIETCASRLDRYINFVKATRPDHLIEVTLSMGNPHLTTHGQRLWAYHLIKLGFTEVTRFRNSNSGNDVVVLHLVIEGGK